MNNVFSESCTKLSILEPGNCARLREPHPSRVYLDWGCAYESVAAPFAGFYLQCPTINRSMRDAEICSLNEEARKLVAQCPCLSATFVSDDGMPNKERDWSLARFQGPDQLMSNIANLKPIAFCTLDKFILALAPHFLCVTPEFAPSVAHFRTEFSYSLSMAVK